MLSIKGERGPKILANKRSLRPNVNWNEKLLTSRPGPKLWRQPNSNAGDWSTVGGR